MQPLILYGFDTIHVRDISLGTAPDAQVMAAALVQGRVLVTRDGDFPRMLAAAKGRAPSIVLLRTPGHDRPGDQLPLLIGALTDHAVALANGCVLVVEEDGVRVRTLPI